jgi:hypothetical protein
VRADADLALVDRPVLAWVVQDAHVGHRLPDHRLEVSLVELERRRERREDVAPERAHARVVGKQCVLEARQVLRPLVRA